MKTSTKKFGTQSGKSSSPPKLRSQRSARNLSSKVNVIESKLDRQKSQKELDRLDQRQQYIKTSCTTLVFMFQDRSEKEFIAEIQPKTYSDLQREIARFTVKHNSIFMCQNENGDMITPLNFKPSTRFVVREIQSRTMIPPVPPAVDIRWDFKGYHARPVQWVDSAEAKKKKEAALKLRAREEDALNHAAGNYGFNASNQQQQEKSWNPDADDGIL